MKAAASAYAGTEDLFRTALTAAEPLGGRWPPVLGPPVTGCFCAQDESARNAAGTPGCGTADGAARRTRGTQTGSPPVPAGRGCRHPTCGAPAERQASAALAMPVRTRNAGTRVRTVRTGSLAPRPALCRAAAARAAGCPMRSYIHGRTAVSPVGTTRCTEGPSSTLTCLLLAENKSAGGRGVSASVPGYRREASSATMSAADCDSLARATPCPAHIESASISPVVPTIGGAGS